MTLRGSLELATAIRAQSDAPVVLMSYCNPVFRMGAREFAHRAAGASVSGVIVPDLPVEEAEELAAALAAAGVHLIYLLSPASTEERIARTAAAASGFIYCMALTGRPDRILDQQRWRAEDLHRHQRRSRHLRHRQRLDHARARRQHRHRVGLYRGPNRRRWRHQRQDLDLLRFQRRHCGQCHLWRRHRRHGQDPADLNTQLQADNLNATLDANGVLTISAANNYAPRRSVRRRPAVSSAARCRTR